MLAGEEALAEVGADDGFWVADGGEVGAGVPLEEEIEVGTKLVNSGICNGVKEIGSQELADAGGVEGGVCGHMCVTTLNFAAGKPRLSRGKSAEKRGVAMEFVW